MLTPTSSWFICPIPSPRASIRLFCFPYAGGGVPVFHTWPQMLPDIEVWVANLPGRGSRFRKTPLTSMPTLVEELRRHLPTTNGRPFSFFGHSMGARVAFELARALHRREDVLPAQLLLSACPAPQLPPEQSLHTLPKTELLAELQRRNGIPAQLMAEPELLDLLLPMVRADIKLYETAVYVEEPPLNCPITTFGGHKDPIVTSEDLSAWASQTTAPFQQLIFPGDHFFLRTAETQLLETIAATLRP